MFIDRATIFVKAGDGGNGCVSFRREKFVPRGGPDGGDGGNGGSVILRADASIDTLLDFSGRVQFAAKNGKHGSGQKKTGASGEDLIIKVPVGTIVVDKDTGLPLRDLDRDEMEVIVAHGGRRGKGNARFATSTNQAPRHAEPGEPGEQRWLNMELKLIADVGLVGKPNAGKSTLLNKATRAHSKVGAYPFTTRHPYLGIVELPGFRRFVMADIPGLIEGSHAGAGLGDEFLRHIERTRLILHVIDLVPYDGTSPVDNYRAICRELELYSRSLAQRPSVVAANKIDIPEAREALESLRAELPDEIFPISAVTGQGVPELMNELWKRVREMKNEEESGSDHAPQRLKEHKELEEER
ncbi:MAG TPA: GTPase ObgE [Planctomycetota bacterium]|nr:GTPase ObgE [Planctomycetota bacterium]